MIKWIMNGIPREQWQYWGSNDRDRALNMIHHYYNPHLVRKTLLLLAIVIPIAIMYKWYSPLSLSLTIVWYYIVYEIIIRRIITCKNF